MANFTILEPMSTGDVIDRAVRLYRRNFTPLVAIVSIPTLIGYVASLMFWYGYQHLVLGAFSSSIAPDDAIWMLVLGALGYPVWLFVLLLTVSGLARVVGDHLMMGEAITFRRCLSSVRSRLKSIIMMGLLMMVILFALYIVFTMLIIVLTLIVGAVIGFVVAAGMPQWVVTSITVIIVLVAIAACLFIISMLIARVIFLPHVVMIEGQGAGAAFSRAVSLGGKNSFKVGAILLFTYFVSLSLMAALTLPVLAVLYLTGFLTSDFFSTTTWTVLYTSFKDASSLLSIPIWIVSFTLLYFDSRVRKEAYDLDLLARDIAPGYHWQPPSQAGPFGYQMPTSYAQGREYVQTSPLGLAGYSTARSATVDTSTNPADEPRMKLANEIGVDAQGYKSALSNRVLCESCGVMIETDAPFCGNCGNPTAISTS